MNETTVIPQHAYFGSLEIEDVKSFKGKHFIDLSDGAGNPALWTIILGDNNTGKTTILKLLADFEPIEIPFKDQNTSEYEDVRMCSPRNLSRIYETQNTPKHDKISNGFFKVDSTILIENNSLNNEKSSSGFIPLKVIPPSRDIFNLKDNKMPDININTYKNWSFGSEVWRGIRYEQIGGLKIFSYAVNRRLGRGGLRSRTLFGEHDIFNEEFELLNAEDWLLQTYLAKVGFLAKMNDAKEAPKRYDEIISILKKVLPDVNDFTVRTNRHTLDSQLIALTDYGEVNLRSLGYGYQTTLALIVDLASKLFETYPESLDALREPAVVLIDEIDIHLHPEWQRNIIGYLSDFFPRVQFIVTAHSPLVVQSARNANIIVLQKTGDKVSVTNNINKSFEGWTVEEILEEIMGMDERTQSELYLNVIKEFESAIERENYSIAKEKFEILDKILHEQNELRTLFRIQLRSLERDSNDKA